MRDLSGEIAAASLRERGLPRSMWGYSRFSGPRVGREQPRRCGKDADLFGLLRVSLATMKKQLRGYLW